MIVFYMFSQGLVFYILKFTFRYFSWYLTFYDLTDLSYSFV